MKGKWDVAAVRLFRELFFCTVEEFVQGQEMEQMMKTGTNVDKKKKKQMKKNKL